MSTTIAIRLPLSMGSSFYVFMVVTYGEEGLSNMNDIAVDIMRDAISLSMGTTNTWAIISIMFR